MSDLILEIPSTRLDLPWSKLDTSVQAGAAGKALKAVLTAVYDNHPAALTGGIDENLVKRFGGIEQFVSAFRASLANAGQLTAVALLPSPDPAHSPGSVRFLVKGEAEPGYRLFGFKRTGQTYVYEDVQPDPVTSLELSAFRSPTKPAPAQQSGGEAVRFPLAAGDACAPVLTGRGTFIAGPLAPKSTGNAVVDFLSGCRSALEDNRTDEFLSCFSPDRAKQLRDLLGSLTPEQRPQFVRSQFDIGTRALLFSGGDLNVLFFRRQDRGRNLTIGHMNIVRTGASSFELIDALTSGVLDSAMSTAEFSDQISRMIPVKR